MGARGYGGASSTIGKKARSEGTPRGYQILGPTQNNYVTTLPPLLREQLRHGFQTGVLPCRLLIALKQILIALQQTFAPMTCSTVALGNSAFVSNSQASPLQRENA